MEDRIAKEQLNVILLVDASKSMGGDRIAAVNAAIHDVKNYLIDLQGENTNVDFYMTIIPFSTYANFYDNKMMINVSDLDYQGIKTGGWSNLHMAYEKLDDILKKKSKGGAMPDFGGLAPIVLLLTDGHPTSDAYKEKLKVLEKSPWFKTSLRYGVAIELKDDRTIQVLRDFVGENGDVVQCFDSTMLKNIIKVIVITASKVKSSSSRVNLSNNTPVNQNNVLQQDIKNALNEVDNWEW